jgi:hypothetical protein
MFQYIKSLLPTWPDYVLKDWVYGLARGDHQAGVYFKPDADFGRWGFNRETVFKMIADAGLSPDTKWQLIPNMKFTMDMFEPNSKRKLIGRAGGSSDMGMGIPKDAERHATQAALAQQQGGIRKEPVILIKTPQGYELLEGWHRTIQHFARYPDGYVGPAYVAVAQGKPGVTEGFSNDMSTEDMIAYLRQHHDTNLHQDYLDHINTFSKFVLQNIPVNSIKTNLPALDRAKVEQYKQMDFSKAPPIVIGGGYILDGYHRANVAKALGIPTIKAYVGVQGQQGVTENMAADQVLDYVKRTHAPEEFDIEYSITDHPEWELKTIPLSQLNLDPDGEAQDPYNRVNWVDDDKVQELIPRIGSVLKSNPIVVDPAGWIIDGNHRAMAAAEAGMTSVPALVPVKQDMAENMNHSKDGRAVEELKSALLAKRDQLQSATDDQVYSIIDKMMTRIARSHSISGQKLHDMWVDKYKQIPDTWIMNENFADGRVKGKSRPGRVKRAGASCAGSVTDLRAKARKYGGERGKMYHWCANMKGGKK